MANKSRTDAGPSFLSLSRFRPCDSGLWWKSLLYALNGSSALDLTDPYPSTHVLQFTILSFSIARARAAMLSSMSSEGRMSFSYVKQKSEDSPKVSVTLILQTHTHTFLGIKPGCEVAVVHVFSDTLFH